MGCGGSGGWLLRFNLVSFASYLKSTKKTLRFEGIETPLSLTLVPGLAIPKNVLVRGTSTPYEQ
jgi:hypothetical protein